MKLKKIIFDLFVYILFLIFFLVLLEISLGLIGKLILIYRQHDVNVSNKDNLTIACFGDSYTYGGLGLRSTSYPAYLNNLCKSANVENKGVCESNSTQVLNDIKKYIKTNKIPNIAIVLVGASNKYNSYGMEKFNFYQKFRIYKMFEIIKLSIKNRILKKNIDKEFTDECISGYYLFSDIKNINNDLKKVDYAYGIIEEINYYIAILYSRSDVIKRLDVEEKIKKLLDTLDNEQKKLMSLDLYNIYNFLKDEKQEQYYYDLIYKKNPEKAKSLKCENLLKLYYLSQNDNEKIKILNDIAYIDPKFGYERFVDFYIRKIPYIKEENKRKETIDLINKYMNKYFSYEPDEIRKKQIQVLYYINTFDFDKAMKLYETELKNNDKDFDIYFYVKMAYCLVYCNRFSDAIYYFLQSFKLNKDNYIDKNICYYFMKSFDLQNKYSADYVLKVFDEILKDKKQLINQKYIMDMYEKLNKIKQNEKAVLKWLKKDLEEISVLCKNNNIKLIFQTYPFPYNSVNNTIREVCNADKNLILIDQNSIFQELVKKDGSSPYFLDFDHCTEKGHYIMAEHIYSVLLEKKLIKE